MIRSAAKNHASVTVVVDPADYEEVLAALESQDGARRPCHFASGWPPRRLPAPPPMTRRSPTGSRRHLADGNARRSRLRRHAQQVTALWREPASVGGVLCRGAVRSGSPRRAQLQGKELSYNNINDTDAAFELVAEFDPARAAACAIIKHANPCGVGMGASLVEAYQQALACDPVSAFGGIVAVNRGSTRAAAEEIVKIFTEVIIAPGADEEALAMFAAKKNLRLLVTGGLADRAGGRAVRSSRSRAACWCSRATAGCRRLELKVVTKTRTDASRVGRSEIRLQGRQTCQVQCHRLCARRGDSRHRRRPDVPGRFSRIAA